MIYILKKRKRKEKKRKKSAKYSATFLLVNESFHSTENHTKQNRKQMNRRSQFLNKSQKSWPRSCHFNFNAQFWFSSHRLTELIVHAWSLVPLLITHLPTSFQFFSFVINDISNPWTTVQSLFNLRPLIFFFFVLKQQQQ